MISRRSFVQQTSGAALATSQTAPTQRGEKPGRPNLVFIFSDQQSSDMLGCAGNEQIFTPNLDRFAKTAVRFNHCVASSPLCTPYRGLLLSGQHPLASGAIANDVRMLAGKGNYFGEVLRNAGYRMGYIGKWHLYGGDRVRPIPPGPDRYGFDHRFLSNNCTVVFDPERAYYWDEQGRRTLYGDWEPYAQARQAEQFITENSDKPFALFLSWHPPHNWASGQATYGYGAPEDVLGLYDPAKIRLRGNCEDDVVNRKIYQGHMAMCTSLDRAFAGILRKIDDLGLAENTIIVYTSDHGDTLRSHGLLFNKMRPEIESIRVPLLMRYPRLLKPRVSNLLVGTLDFMPTLLAMMELSVPRSCQGKNLATAIAKGNDNAVDSVPLFLLPLDWRGVYTRRFTYCMDTSGQTKSSYRQRFFEQPAGVSWNCLWDHQTDPWEKKNLFGSLEHRRSQNELHEKTLSWMRRFGDKGIGYETLRSKVFESPSDGGPGSYRDGATGVLKGRPRDLV